MLLKRFAAPFLVEHFLELSAERLPEKVAVVWGEGRFSYAEVLVKVYSLASALHSLGVRRHDRVAVLLDNSIEAVIAIFAVLKVGAVFVPLSPTLKSKKLSFILNDCKVSLLVAHANQANTVNQAVGGLDCVQHVLWVASENLEFHMTAGKTANHLFHDTLLCSPCSSTSGLPSNNDLDLAAIIYTSGSTGRPKGVMLTHSNVLAACHSIITYLENREDDVILDLLPLSFDYGLYQILMAFCFGGTVVLERGFAYPFQVVRKMVEERITGFPGVPTVFSLLLRLEDLASSDFQHLRYITSTGEPLRHTQAMRLKQVFPRARIFSMYGLTECKRVSYLPPEELDRRPGSVGKGMPNQELWIVDENGHEVGPGQVGELVVRGSNVMVGYWGLPNETARVIRQGRCPGERVLYTGDLFKRDEDGFLYFVSRKDDMFKSKGKMIGPKEVEECLCSLRGVRAAVVFGVPDEILGNMIVACVCLDNHKLDTDDIRRHCEANLEDHLVPHIVKILPSLCLTATGKTHRQALREGFLKESSEADCS